MLYFILGAITLAIIEWVWITYFKDDYSTNKYSASGDSSAGCERKLQESKNLVSDRDAQIGHLQARISVLENDADQSQRSMAGSSRKKTSKPKAASKSLAATKKKAAPPKKVVTKKKAVAKAPAKKKVVAKAPAKRAGASKSKPDDLKKVSGIGPKIAGLMKVDGIDSFATLAKTDIKQLDAILDKAGSRFAMADASSWPKQASLLQKGDKLALQKLQKSLKDK